MDEAPWYRTLFDEQYLRLWAPNLPPERAQWELEGLLKLLDLPPGASVLDLCCGHGRHAVPLAQRGDGSAQFNIGRMYARGEGVQRNLPEAYKWFTLAALAGRSEAERARQAIGRTMTPVQMAEGLRRAEAWRQQRR